MSFATTTVITSANIDLFPEEYSPQHKCCCGKNDIATATKIVRIVEIIISLLGFIGAFVEYDVQKYLTIASFASTLVFVILQLVVSLIMIYGVYNENQWLILPALIYEGIGAAILSILTGYLVITSFIAGFVITAIVFMINLGKFWSNMAYVVGDKPFQPQQTTFVYATPHIFPEEHSPRYQCCCCSTVSAGARIIGILQIIGCSIVFFYSCISFAVFGVAGYYFTPVSIVTIIFVVAQIICSSLMLYGISRNDHRFILPDVIYNGIGLVGIVIGIILGIVIIAKSNTVTYNLCYNNFVECEDNGWNYDVYQTAVIVYGVLVIIFLGVSLAFSIWFFVVILRCYQYVKAKAHWLHHSHPPATVTMPGYQMQYVTPQSGVAYSPQPGVGYAQQAGAGYTQASNMAFTQQSNMGYNPHSNNTAFAPASQP